METATGLLKIMLENGWNLRKKDFYLGYCDRDKETIEDEIKRQVDCLCDMLSHYDEMPVEEVEKQIADIVLKHIKDNTLKNFNNNLFLFDYKGKPICAVPDWVTGKWFCDFVKREHGIYLQFAHYFESQKERSLNEWGQLYMLSNDPLKLKEKITELIANY